MTEPRPDTLLSSEQLAAYLQVPLRTLEGWRQRKTGPAWTKAGRAVRYSKSDVYSWLRREQKAAGGSR